MFACMAGAPPQPAEERRKADRMDPHFTALAERYPPGLVALVRRALSPDPLARPQSLFEMQKALQALETSSLPLAPAAPAGTLSRLRTLARKLRSRHRGEAADTAQG
jgi:hypothetical protein